MSPPHLSMYQPLLNSAEEEYKPPLSPLRDTERPHRPIFTLRDLIAAPSLFFALSCFLSLAISAVNISFLSAHDAFDTYATARKPVRSPSIYPGLENVHWSTPRCRNHTVYPRSYAQIEDKSRRHKLVHAYRDEVTFAFGGEIAADIAFNVRDFGMENCTLTFRVSLPSPSTTLGRSLELSNQTNHHVEPTSTRVRAGYMDSTTSMRIPQDGNLELSYSFSSGPSHSIALPDTFSLASLAEKGGKVTTQPFWCPSAEELHVRAACRGDCLIEFGLQGMTTATSSNWSENKTGFRLQQHENLSCISVP